MGLGRWGLVVLAACSTIACKLEEEPYGSCQDAHLGVANPPQDHVVQLYDSQFSVQEAAALSKTTGQRVVCYSGSCVRDETPRQLTTSSIDSHFARSPNSTQSPDEPHALMAFSSFLDLSATSDKLTQGDDLTAPTQDYANPQPASWVHGNKKPTAMFEVGRYRLPKAGDQSEVEAIIVFENRRFDPRMAPVVVCTVMGLVGAVPSPVVAHTIKAVSHEGFMVVVGSPFQKTDWSKDAFYDVLWFAYGFALAE